MRAYQFPYPETERETVVSRFGGADFRTHPTKVSLSRSPDLQNLICDQNDFLVKRTGWKTQQNYNAPLSACSPCPTDPAWPCMRVPSCTPVPPRVRRPSCART